MAKVSFIIAQRGDRTWHAEGLPMLLNIWGREDWFVWHQIGHRGWQLSHWATGYAAALPEAVARFKSDKRGNAGKADTIFQVVGWLNRRVRPEDTARFLASIDTLDKINGAEPPCAIPATFEAAKARRAEFEAAERKAGAELAAIPGVGSGANGLTPDAVKASPAYREARAAYDRAAANLKAFLAPFLKRYARELRAERRARDKARQAAGERMEGAALVA